MHRIAISPNRYAELSYLAANQMISPKGLLEEWIKYHWDHRDENPNIPSGEEPRGNQGRPGPLMERVLEHIKGQVPDGLVDCNASRQDGKLTPEDSKVPKRGHRDNKRLEDYPDLCAIVDSLLMQSPRPSYAEIGRAVNRSRTTISDYEKRRKLG